ncbi:uncharacterized protein LOC6556886 isoform X3 [Drosophila grimshawi]|uniref:uncharacterized protein LOC6556886 isoform X3 n=1 Tax=Drosophila grimshawi TaxID=7222 RepID=UPI000C86F3FB|nr:uncharacterized protein LOC6556886 isoform X3 [Drosophila grimshawi]
MAPKKSTIVLNVEQFIHDIEERPAIWNRNFHCNKAFLEQMWDELSGTHKLPTDHMRHRLPKNEQDQSYYFNQQSEDCEKTVVEPDLTNGLIRRLQDSDEDFDEDDIDGGGDAGGDVSDASADSLLPTPPAAHQQTQMSTTPLATGALKAQEEAFAASHQHALLKAGLLRAQLMELELEREAQDLSKKSTTTTPLATAAAAAAVAAALVANQPEITPAAPTHCSPPPMVTTTTTMHSALVTAAQLAAAGTVLAPATTTSSTSSNAGAMRSVSPPPLYNKAHHPLPTQTVGHHTAAAKEDFGAGVVSGGGNGSEHLNFTQHSYANGLIPALKLKRPRLSEDSNFNGSSTMDGAPLVPEDDDYHYLLSLHPYMKQLTAAQKLRIRTKIQKLIFKELYKEDLEESK